MTEASEDRIFFSQEKWVEQGGRCGIEEGEWYGCIDMILILLVDCVNQMNASENFLNKGVVIFGNEEFSNLLNCF